MKKIIMDRKLVVIGSLMIFCKDGILMMKRRRDFQYIAFGKGMWELPGGKMEFGEHLKKGVLRELTEETGIKLDENDFKLIDAFSCLLIQKEEEVYRINLIYSSTLENPVTIQLSEEHEEYTFLNNFNKLENMDMFPEMKTILHTSLKQHY